MKVLIVIVCCLVTGVFGEDIGGKIVKTVDLEEASVADLVRFLRRNCGVTVSLRGQKDLEAVPKIYLKLRNVPLESLVEYAAMQTGLEYYLDKDMVYLGKNMRMPEQPVKKPDLLVAAMTVLLESSKIANFSVENEPLPEVFERLCRKTQRENNGVLLNFVILDYPAANKVLLNMSVKGSNVMGLMRIICLAGGLEYKIEPHAVVVFPKKTDKTPEKTEM